MGPRKIVEWLISDRFDPALSVAKWFNSILIFSAIYFLFNVSVVGIFSFKGSILDPLEAWLLFTGHAVLFFALLYLILKGFISITPLLYWATIFILMIVSFLVQSLTLFFAVTSEVISINLKQLLINETQIQLADFSDKINCMAAAIKNSKGLYLVLIACFLFDGVLLAYPIFIVIQFRYSRRRLYFLQYLKIRKSIYNG